MISQFKTAVRLVTVRFRVLEDNKISRFRNYCTLRYKIEVQYVSFKKMFANHTFYGTKLGFYRRYKGATLDIDDQRKKALRYICLNNSMIR